jgi:hypothetical protein
LNPTVAEKIPPAIKPRVGKINQTTKPASGLHISCRFACRISSQRKQVLLWPVAHFTHARFVGYMELSGDTRYVLLPPGGGEDLLNKCFRCFSLLSALSFSLCQGFGVVVVVKLAVSVLRISCFRTIPLKSAQQLASCPVDFILPS